MQNQSKEGRGKSGDEDLLETKERMVRTNRRWGEVKEEKNSKCVCIENEVVCFPNASLTYCEFLKLIN